MQDNTQLVISVPCGMFLQFQKIQFEQIKSKQSKSGMMQVAKCQLLELVRRASAALDTRTPTAATKLRANSSRLQVVNFLFTLSKHSTASVN